MTGAIIQIISGSAIGAFLSSYLDRRLKRTEQLRIDDKQEIDKIEILLDNIIDQATKISSTSSTLASQELNNLFLLNKLKSRIKVLIQRDFDKKVVDCYIKFKNKVDVFDISSSQDKEKDIGEMYKFRDKIIKSIEDDYQYLHTRTLWAKICIYYNKNDKNRFFSEKIKLSNATLATVICTIISTIAAYYITNNQYQKDRLDGVENKRISIIERTENIFINSTLAKDNFVYRSITVDLLKEQKHKHLLSDDKIYEIADRIMNYNKEISKFDSEISSIRTLSSVYFCNNLENKFEKLSEDGGLWWSIANQKLRNEILSDMQTQVRDRIKCHK